MRFLYRNVNFFLDNFEVFSQNILFLSYSKRLILIILNLKTFRFKYLCVLLISLLSKKNSISLYSNMMALYVVFHVWRSLLLKTHMHTHTHTPPVCSLMIKYQRTALDILLVEQDGSTGVTKVGYCSPHPTNACLPFTWEKNGIDFWESFLVSASSGHLFSNPHGVPFWSLILQPESPPNAHIHTAAGPHPPHASPPLLPSPSRLC